MVWIVCDDAVFNATSKRYTPQIVSSGKNLNSASKVANWIIVARYSEVSLLTLYYHWQTHFLLEIVIARDH